MPKKNGKFAKKKTDAKQNSRLKKLESFIYKTIENKQVNSVNTNLAIDTAGVRDGGFLQVAPGVMDGSVVGDEARIGNSITLMRQQFHFTFTQNPVGIIDDWNRIRVIIVEALDGSQPILMSDVLTYHSYAVHGDLVFSSPYTTKTTTNRRYKPLLDKTFELNYRATSGSKVLKYIQKYKDGKVVGFDDLSAIPTNHQISILFISDSGSLPHPLVFYTVRSTYKDA